MLPGGLVVRCACTTHGCVIAGPSLGRPRHPCDGDRAILERRGTAWGVVREDGAAGAMVLVVSVVEVVVLVGGGEPRERYLAR